MRISAWSSYVCPSALLALIHFMGAQNQGMICQLQLAQYFLRGGSLLAGQGKNPRRDGAETGPNQLAPHFAALVQAAIAKTRQYDQSPITPPFGRGAFVDASRRLPR